MKRFLTATAVSLALITTASAGCDVQMKDYKAIRNGMTLSQVNTALGCEGTESNRISIGSDEAVAYTWGESGGVIIGSFTNNRLTMKMQMNLK